METICVRMMAVLKGWVNGNSCDNDGNDVEERPRRGEWWVVFFSENSGSRYGLPAN